MKRRKIFKVSLISLFVLSLIIVIHIILVVDTSPVDNGNIQLTRIDIKGNTDKSASAPMQTFVSNIEGVNQTVLNEDGRNIVVGFDNNVTSIKKIHDRVNEQYPQETTMYIPSDAELAASCPVINRNTNMYKMISAIKNIF